MVEKMESLGRETVRQTGQPGSDQVRREVEVLCSEFLGFSQEVLKAESALQSILSGRTEFQLKQAKFEKWLEQAESQLKSLSKPMEPLSIEEVKIEFEVCLSLLFFHLKQCDVGQCN